jgi:penicillin-binding protein 1C
MSPLPSANFLIPALTMARERESPSRLRRGLRAGLIAASTAIIAVVCAAVYWVSSLGPAPLGEGLAFSALVVDRDGKLLRPYATPEGRWRLPATRENVDPRFLQLLLAYEDKRFRTHHGVDPLALGRALVQLITQGRIVSGASTISMQVARLLEPRGARSFKAKLRQMLRAIEIERTLSKDEILALYLSLAPYGGNLEGVRAASLAYFGKEPRRLTLGEAAMLVGLPQSPEQRRPDRSTAAARNARDRVLDRVCRRRHCAFRRDRARQARVGAGRTQAHADIGATCGRRGGRRGPRAKRSSPHDRCGAAEEFGGACARAGPRARA